MKQAEKLRCLIRQLQEVAADLDETQNPRDRATRIRELEWYLEVISLAIEAIRDYHFRMSPQHGLARAILRHSPTPKENDKDIQE